MIRKVKRAGMTSVQIRPEVAKILGRFVKRGMSKSQLINEALRQYLIEKEFQEVRSQMIPFSQKKGIYTDEDVDRLLR